MNSTCSCTGEKLGTGVLQIHAGAGDLLIRGPENQMHNSLCLGSSSVPCILGSSAWDGCSSRARPAQRLYLSLDQVTPPLSPFPSLTKPSPPSQSTPNSGRHGSPHCLSRNFCDKLSPLLSSSPKFGRDSEAYACTSATSGHTSNSAHAYTPCR
jgi:hypothetical protein